MAYKTDFISGAGYMRPFRKPKPTRLAWASGVIYIWPELCQPRMSAWIACGKKPIPQFYKQRSNLFPQIAALLMKERVSILDFGGGLGIGCMTLLESLPEAAARVAYSIVEVPEVCKAGEKLHGGGGQNLFVVDTRFHYF